MGMSVKNVDRFAFPRRIGALIGAVLSLVACVGTGQANSATADRVLALVGDAQIRLADLGPPSELDQRQRDNLQAGEYETWRRDFRVYELERLVWDHGARALLREHGLYPTADEIRQVTDGMGTGSGAAVLSLFAEALIVEWRHGRLLHARYGGRGVVTDMGVLPVEAFVRFLENDGLQGHFEIRDREYWRGFAALKAAWTARSLIDAAQIAAHFETPPWKTDDR